MPSWMILPRDEDAEVLTPVAVTIRIPLPADLIFIIALFLEADMVVKKNKHCRTLANLSQVSKEARGAVLEILWKYQSLDIGCVIRSKDVIPYARVYNKIVRCPNSIHHPGFLHIFESLKCLKTFTLETIKSNKPCSTCAALDSDILSSLPNPPLSNPQVVDTSLLKKVNLVNVALDIERWKTSPLVFQSVESVGIFDVIAVAGNKSVARVMDFVALMFPEVKDLMYFTPREETVDNLKVLLAPVNQGLTMKNLQSLKIQDRAFISKERRVMKHLRNGCMTVTGPKNFLFGCPRPQTIHQNLTQEQSGSFVAPYIPGGDEARDLLYSFYESLCYSNGVIFSSFPNLKELDLLVTFSWKGCKEIYSLYALVSRVTHLHPLLFQHYTDRVHPVREPEPIHPDGSLGCQVPDWADCALGQKVKDVEGSRGLVCQVCYNQFLTETRSIPASG